MYLRSIVADLNQRCSSNIQLPDTSSFVRRLISLKPIEKDYIASFITKKEWNLGTPNVLEILTESKIITMTDYMLYKIEFEDSMEVQFILNDLLETKFSLSASLVENLGLGNLRSQMVTQSLEEGFRTIIEDVVVRGHSLKKNYIQEMEPFLSEEQITRLRLLNLKFFLEIEVENCSLAEAITQLSRWIDEMSNLTNESNRSINQLIHEILKSNEKVLNYLMKKVVSDKFRGWKWYCVIFRKMCPDLKTHSVQMVKSFLKDLYESFLLQKNINFFFTMILMARMVYSDDKNQFGDYSQWYKAQFSEMRYRISKDEFIATLEALQLLISYENDVDILQMYAQTSISPPTLCNDLVLSFKQICRSKIERLKLDRSGDRCKFTEIVLLDDEDDTDGMEF